MKQTYDAVQRKHFILKLLRLWGASGVSLRKICTSVNNSMGDGHEASQRTYERDLSDLKNLTKDAVKYDRKNKVYRLDDAGETDSTLVNWYLELQYLTHFAEYAMGIQQPGKMGIAFKGPRQPENLQWIKPILEAVNQSTAVKILYRKFQDATERTHIVFPDVLVVHAHRWYMIGKAGVGTSAKRITFSLDRILELKPQDMAKPRSDAFDLDEFLAGSIGIIKPYQPPVIIRLWFDNAQSHYIKTLELHSSQKVIQETAEGTTFEITVAPDYEFYAKLLSYGPAVKVLAPESVQQELTRLLIETLHHYSAR